MPAASCAGNTSSVAFFRTFLFSESLTVRFASALDTFFPEKKFFFKCEGIDPPGSKSHVALSSFPIFLADSIDPSFNADSRTPPSTDVLTI